MPVPEISHLQLLLLSALTDGEQTGRVLRDLLAKENHKKSAPAFYQLMARMEDAKLVKGRYEQKIVEGQIIKERVYSITGSGLSVYNQAVDFYQAMTRRSAWGGEMA